jgi:hypothetical protein
MDNLEAANILMSGCGVQNAGDMARCYFAADADELTEALKKGAAALRFFGDGALRN